MSSLPLQFFLATIAGWMTRDHQKVVAYLLAENKVLRAHVHGKRIRFSDAQRRKLAQAAKALGRKELSKLDTLQRARASQQVWRAFARARFRQTKRAPPATARVPAGVLESQCQPRR